VGHDKEPDYGISIFLLVLILNSFSFYFFIFFTTDDMNFYDVKLRSLALPFTVLEWTLPAVPRPTPTQNGGSTRQSYPAASADLSNNYFCQNILILKKAS
jgi:hypothetical protein